MLKFLKDHELLVAAVVCALGVGLMLAGGMYPKGTAAHAISKSVGAIFLAAAFFGFVTYPARYTRDVATTPNVQKNGVCGCPPSLTEKR